MSRTPPPFHSQLVNWNHEDSGFPNVEEVARWQPNACGIACLRMVLDAFEWGGRQDRLSYWELLSLGIRSGAYSERGWIHQGLLELGQSYGLRGLCRRNCSIADVIESVRRDALSIVSVTRGLEGGFPDEAGLPLPRGGHLVVVFDCQESGGSPTTLVCNHPSSRPQWNRAGWSVALERWEASFSGSFIEFEGSGRRQPLS